MTAEAPSIVGLTKELHERVQDWITDRDNLAAAYRLAADAVARESRFESYQHMELQPYGLVRTRVPMTELELMAELIDLADFIALDGNGSQFDSEWIVEQAARIAENAGSGAAGVR